MGKMKNLLIFLESYDIDTEYYLNDMAREMYEAGELDLRALEQAPVEVYAEYLDLAKIMKEEDV